MKIRTWINGKEHTDDIALDTVLLDYLRQKGCYSVKRGCDTTNCGLCTVWLEEKPVLSCAVLAARVDSKHVTTLEGVQEEAEKFGSLLADDGADQCGFCSPGFIMSVIAMKKELKNPDEAQIKAYLSGNLCRCTGYMGQMRAIRRYMQDTEDIT